MPYLLVLDDDAEVGCAVKALSRYCDLVGSYEESMRAATLIGRLRRLLIQGATKATKRPVRSHGARPSFPATKPKKASK